MSTEALLVIGKIEMQAEYACMYSSRDLTYYHVRASKEEAKNLKLGDTIEYDLGPHVGWLLRKK